MFNSSFGAQPQLTAAAPAQGLYLASGVAKDVTITAPETNNASTTRLLTLSGTATLGGQASAGIMLDDSANHSLTIGSPTNQIAVKLNTSTGFYVNNAGTLALTGLGDFNLNSSALTLGGTHASGKIVIDKLTQNNPGSLIVNTAGTVTLSSNGSAHSGGTTLNAGRLNINGTKALGGAGGTFTVNGGTIDNTSGAAVTVANANPLNLNADVYYVGGGLNTEHDLTFGAGATTLNGAPGARTLTVAATNSTLGIKGVIGNGTATGLIKAGGGTLTLSGLNTYTNITTVNGGVLRLDNTNAIPGGILAKGGTSALTLNGGVVELTGNSGTAFNRDLGTSTEQIQLTGGASGFSSVAASGRTVNFNNDAHTITWGDPAFSPSVLVLQEAAATVDTLIFANPIDLGADVRTVAVKASTAALSGTLSGAGGSLVKIGFGTLMLDNNTNTFDGGLLIKSGAVKVKGTGTSLGNGTVTLGDSATGEDATLIFSSNGAVGNTFTNLFFISGGSGSRTISSLGMASAANFSINGAIALSNNLTIITPTGDGSLKFSGGITGAGNLTLNANAKGATTLQTSPVNMVGTLTNSGIGTNTTIISAVIGANVTGVIQNSTNSVLKLSGVNTYPGTTTVNAGTLELTTNNCLSAASSVVIADSGANLYLHFTGTNTVNTLYIGNKQQARGTWGSTASTADHKDNAYFSATGTGVLKVTTGPVIGTMVRIF